ncbi:DUF4198 domain-containing protein [Oxalicibacterium faecigallinarum]|uniref:ABC transporter permease n=1 Tax=Oxalicibacterium faecigallinarum TaxID=573741 RepID=A0A8J3AU01_9BURK|nr:DUF4198 domain-containing protein [Oxalicibacterium faecigallinarum]GGI19300.1 ABC transporter permease [Oxalicibacterium faecigallinarum]
MMKPSLLRMTIAAAALSLTLPMVAHAHRGWLLPSSTVLSGAEWIAVDAGISNDVFAFKLGPLPLNKLRIIGPDGKEIAPENLSSGKTRNSFEFRPSAQGTYKASVTNETLVATYTQGKNNKRWRGKAENFAKEIPADATNVNVSLAQAQFETFITVGKPSDTVLKPKNVGLELVLQSAPNDLYAGDTTQFQFLIDGKPAANLDVSVIPGGARYRDKLGEIRTRTDASGKFSVTWANAGMFWLNASEDNGELQVSGPGSAVAITPSHALPVGTIDKPTRRASYTATLEVLQP